MILVNNNLLVKMGTVTMYLHLVSGRMKISDESDDVCFFVDCSFFRRFSKHVNCF